jgi:hypothetical protein
MTELKTWAGRSSFRYSGSVEEGTKIFFGSGQFVNVTSADYSQLLDYKWPDG